MPRKTADYFRYLPATPDARRWGVVVTASGLTHIPAGVAYPPAKHPADHAFDWKHGRVLEALQIVLISAGGGWLETRATGRRRVHPGMAFMLFPGEWHRYRPDPRTGWRESWIEVQGPVVDDLLSAGTFAIGGVLRPRALDVGLEQTLDEIHRLVRQAGVTFQTEISATALKALAQSVRAGHDHGRQMPRVQLAVVEATRILNEQHSQPVNVERLASDLGIAYSHFRRAFRAYTGHAPWQYVLHLRLSRARRLLASGDAKLDEIAERVGFSSGFHLSAAFKRAYGQPPDSWRRSLAK